MNAKIEEAKKTLKCQKPNYNFKFEGYNVGCVTFIGRRPTNEDSHVTVNIAAVLDGHGGDSASKEAAAKLYTSVCINRSDDVC